MASAMEKDGVADVSMRQMADAIRVLSMDGVQAANSGHPGMPMGMADAATVLFTRFLKYDAADPAWPDRDRFILSAGHGSMLLYSLLYLTGVPGMDIEQVKNFRQLGYKTAGHPEYGHAPGIETTTGPLGQGIANAVGFAMAERHLNAKYGDGIADHFTYVIAGDGCLMEGISQEAIGLAGHLKLGKLIVLFDDNSITIDGSTDLSTSEDQLARFEASGWEATRVDGHDHDALATAIAQAQKSDRPSLIACKTTIGYGAPNKQGTSSTHGAPLGDEEIAATRQALGWTAEPFEMPQAILASWRSAGSQGRAQREAWEARAAKLDDAARAGLGDPVTDAVAEQIRMACATAKKAFIDDTCGVATRVSSKMTLDHLVPVVPGLIGGSADLTGSNGTLTSHHETLDASAYGGNYVNYGVREHGMAAAMNGMALHGGVVPYGATFLVFTDYCRPSIRLSALMEQRVIYVMTHDSIGLGEDGPTHQPVEHLAALRAMPNLNVFRPSDAVEVAECWELALTTADRPSVLVLSRQGLPLQRCDADSDNRSGKGAYVLRDVDGGARDVTLLATGSEVQLAQKAADTLADSGVKAAVVSMPCWELFRSQEEAYRRSVLGDAPRVGVEAAMAFGWHEWLGDRSHFVGMDSFGASAPASALFDHFGITADAVVAAAKKLV